MRKTIFLFGEAEKGEFCTPIHCKTLPQMVDTLGHPPGESRGVHYAVQTLLCDREVFFFRVQEEGYSREDYMRGLKLIQSKEIFTPVSAICMPGVGDAEIIDASNPVCDLYKIFLIIDEKDLYDYLTCKIFL
jgi:hypothetical protein